MFPEWACADRLAQKKTLAGFCQKPPPHIINMLSHTYTLFLRNLHTSPSISLSFLCSLSQIKLRWPIGETHCPLLPVYSGSLNTCLRYLSLLPVLFNPLTSLVTALPQIWLYHICLATVPVFLHGFSCQRNAHVYPGPSTGSFLWQCQLLLSPSGSNCLFCIIQFVFLSCLSCSLQWSFIREEENRQGRGSSWVTSGWI